MTAYPCSALVGGKCFNGFPVTRGCIYMDNWRPERAPVPVCCDEEWPHDSAQQRPAEVKK